MELSERFVLEGTRNTRDLGGYPTKDGRHVAYKKLIRTDAMGMLTNEDVEKLVNAFHPRHDIDLRSEEEATLVPDVPLPNCEYIRLSMHGNSSGKMEDHHTYLNLSNHTMDRLIDFIYLMDKDGDIDKAMQNSSMICATNPIAIESLRKILEICRDNQEGSVIFHCKDGKDRTGFVAAMILGLLGVDRKDIIKDYLKTNENMTVKFKRRTEQFKNDPIPPYLYQGLIALAGVRENWLAKALDYIDENYGDMEGYVKEVLKLTDEDIKKIKDAYLEY